MLDVTFLGRETARNPIHVKSARRIEHDARWATAKRIAGWAATCILLAVSVCIVVVGLWG